MEIKSSLFEGLKKAFDNSAEGLKMTENLSDINQSGVQRTEGLAKIFQLLDGTNQDHWKSIQRIIRTLDVKIDVLGKYSFTADDMSKLAKGTEKPTVDFHSGIKAELDNLVNAKVSEIKETGVFPVPK